MKQMIKVFLAVTVLLCIQCKGESNKRVHEQASDEIAVKKMSENFIQITGYIHNRDHSPNTTELQIEIPHLSGGKDSTIISPIREDETFYFEFELNQPQDISMKPYLPSWDLVPGDSLHLELDFKNLMDVRLWVYPKKSGASFFMHRTNAPAQ